MKIIVALLVALVLSGCATLHPGAVSELGPGFWKGLWHGTIAPFAFIAHFFTDGVAIYETPNNGGWYDFGFLLGLSAWAGGSSAASK
jgi:hypothetical protein